LGRAAADPDHPRPMSMPSFADELASAIRPYLGAATEGYVRSLADGIGKDVASLDAGDLPAIEGELRRSLSAVAASGTIATIITDIRSGP
jgi:hypothetical protein